MSNLRKDRIRCQHCGATLGKLTEGGRFKLWVKRGVIAFIEGKDGGIRAETKCPSCGKDTNLNGLALSS